MDPKLTAAYLLAIAFDVAMPLALATYARRRLGVSWRYFWYGALIFFLFQMISRVPAVQILQVVLAEPLRGSAELRWAWLLLLALTAGLSEEVGRYVGYRWLIFRGSRASGDAETGRRGDGERGTQDSGLRTQDPSALSTHHASPAAWRKAVMYGLGHGGLESMLLLAVLTSLGLINALVILRMDPSTVPPEQAEAFRQAHAALVAVPWWMPLLGAFERLSTVTLQVGFSVLVLQAFLRGSLRWLYLAIVAHFLVDFAAVGAAQALGPVGTEGLIALFALAALLLIFRLRPRDDR